MSRLVRFSAVLLPLILAVSCGSDDSGSSNTAAAPVGTTAESVAASTSPTETTAGTGGTTAPTETTAGSGGTTAGALSFESSEADGVTDDEILVGHMSDLTGPSTDTGAPLEAGFRAYMDFFNSTSDIGGRKITVISEDDAFEAERARTNFIALTEDRRVLSLSGFTGSQIISTLDPDFTRAKVPVIGTYQTIDIQFKNDYVWSTAPHYADEAEVAVAYAVGKAGSGAALKVAAVVLEVPSGQQWAAYVEREVTEAGGQFVKTLSVPISITDATAVVTQLKDLIDNQGVNYVAWHGSVGTALTLFGDMARLGVSAPIFGIQTLTAPQIGKLPDSINGDMAGMWGFTPPTTATPGSEELLNYIKGTEFEEFGNNVTFVQGWVNAKVTVEAIKRAASTGELTRASLQEALATIDDFETDGLSGTIDFTRPGHNGGAQNRPYQWVGGVLQPIGEYADSEDVLSFKYEL